jgi:Flp pilus assembly protein CpaB
MTIDYRIRNIVIAGALAAAAVLLTVIYVTTARGDDKAGAKEVTVYVAKRDFPAGTAGSKVAGAVEAVVVQRKAAAPQAIEAPKQVAGLYSAQPIYAGEQVSLLRFTPPKAQGVRVDIAGKLRAYQVPGDANQLLAGTLAPNDRVDVVAVFKPSGIEQNSRATVALRNLRVLETVENDEGSVASGNNGKYAVVLAVTDEQAQTLSFVVENGEWTLQLRPVKKPKDSKHSVTTLDSVLRGPRS